MSGTDLVTIREIGPDDGPRWDTFVHGCSDATIFHRAGWKRVLEEAFGHETHYLYAESAGQIVGVLPLGHIRSRLFGNALISTPFCVYGGVAATSPMVRSSLESAARQLAVKLEVDFLELRNREHESTGFLGKELYVTFRKAIDPDPEKNMLAIPRKQRAMVRKGKDAGLVSVVDPDMDRFYDAYAQSVHRLGTPVFSKKYFCMLKSCFGNDCEVLTITRGENVVASVVNFYFRDEVLPYYGGGTAEARTVAGNDFMYWEVMRRACERGIRIFDYGRSKVGTGSYAFKKNWGFEPTALRYGYSLVKAREVPDVNPLNPKYALFIAAWKRLPLAMTKLIGPMISRNLG